MGPQSEVFDVAILGAGMAGLTAARALGERGLRVLVLEARERVGGRVLSVPVEGGDTVELGAEFVHGRAPDLWALIAEAGVQTTERDGTMLRESPEGGLEADTEDAGGDAMFAPLEQLVDYTGPDIPFADWLAASDVEPWVRPAVTGYVEGFNAADATRIGVLSLGAQQKAEDLSEGDRSWHVHGGYAQLAEYLAARVQALRGVLHLGCEVRAVRWAEGAVTVETSQGSFAARQCIVTLPLGVLQRANRGGIQLVPEPAALAQARRLAMGHATRFTLVFRERWWLRSTAGDAKSLEAMSFVFTPGRLPPVWWTSGGEPEALPTLTGWVGGPRAAALEGRSAEELGRAACADLAEIFAVEEAVVYPSLVATCTHDWARDPYALGAYSYVPAGALDASAAMAQPEAATLFFAGEHTDTSGHWGTVHAAMRTGLRAAAQVVGDAD